MEKGQSKSRKLSREYRYSGWLLLAVGILMAASFFYTYSLWTVKLPIIFFFLVSSACLFWKARRLS
jgi:uncharacterized membrane protein YjjP (DUF1212 family)